MSRAAPSISRFVPVLPYLALAGSMLSFCLGTSLARQLFPALGAPGTAACRVGFSALILLAVFRPWRRLPSRADALRVMRYGAVLGLMNLCFYMALRTIPLGLAIAVEFLGPLTVALLHSRRVAQFALVAMAVAGLALLLPLATHRDALDPSGFGFALGAGLFWALYILFGQRVGHVPPGVAVSLGMASAAAIVVPIGIATSGAALLSPTLMLVGLAAAALSSSLPYSLEIFALRHIPAQRFGILLSLEPALGAITGALLLGEALSPRQWLAIALVMIASAGSVLTGERGAIPA